MSLVEELFQVVDLLAKLHLRREDTGVFQNTVGGPQVGSDHGVVLELQRLALARQVVELALLLGLAYPLLHDGLHSCEPAVLLHRRPSLLWCPSVTHGVISIRPKAESYSLRLARRPSSRPALCSLSSVHLFPGSSRLATESTI